MNAFGIRIKMYQWAVSTKKHFVVSSPGLTKGIFLGQNLGSSSVDVLMDLGPLAYHRCLFH